MLYEYSCPVCGIIERYQSCHEQHEYCQCDCGRTATRFWRPQQIAVSNIWQGYNHGLGCYVRNYRDVKDACKRYHDETGVELVEVGTETLNTTPRPRRTPYPTASQLGY